MKYLIVNGDDFGASRGINRGILEAHQRGILTSASLLVDAPGSEEAARLGRAAPELSVGLHVDLANRHGDCRAELSRQLARFAELMGRGPTHLDSHHNGHRAAQALPYFLDLARQHGLPLREHSPVRYFSKFYGQRGGERYLEQVSVERLACMLEMTIEDGITELSCHPGYVDPEFSSGYHAEREAELRTLCDPRIRQTLAEHTVQLISYHDLAKALASAAT